MCEWRAREKGKKREREREREKWREREREEGIHILFMTIIFISVNNVAQQSVPLSLSPASVANVTTSQKKKTR